MARAIAVVAVQRGPSDWTQVVAGKIDEAFEAHVAPTMRHHNPEFAGDAAGLRSGMKENHADHPDKVFTVHQTVTDGETVAVHSRIQMESEDTGMAVVHLFRFEQGRIVEMWSVGQPGPEEMVNENGLF